MKTEVVKTLILSVRIYQDYLQSTKSLVSSLR